MKTLILLSVSFALGGSSTSFAEKQHLEQRALSSVSVKASPQVTQSINTLFSQTAVDPVINRSEVGARGSLASTSSSFADRIRSKGNLASAVPVAPSKQIDPRNTTPQNSDGNMPDTQKSKTTSAITSRAGNITLQEANGDDWGSKVSFHSSQEGDYICVDRGTDGTTCTEPGTATQNTAKTSQKVWQEYMEATNAEGISMAEFHGCPEARQTGSCPGGPAVGSVKLMTTGNVPMNTFSGAASSDPMDPKNLYYGFPNGDVKPNDIAAVFVVNGRARAGGGGGGGSADDMAEGM